MVSVPKINVSSTVDVDRCMETAVGFRWFAIKICILWMLCRLCWVAERGLEPPTLVVYLIVVAVWSCFAFYIVHLVVLRQEFETEGESTQKREQGPGLKGAENKKSSKGGLFIIIIIIIVVIMSH